MASNRVPSDNTVNSSGDGGRMDIDSEPHSRNSSLTTSSIHEAPQTYTDRAQRITHLTGRLQNLQLEAQRQLNQQPKSTQLDLTTQTRTIFTPYGKHGSQAILSNSINKYLSSDHNTDHLQIWSASTAASNQVTAGERMKQFRVITAAKAIRRAQKHTTTPSFPLTPTELAQIPHANPEDSPLDGPRTTTNDEETTSLIRDWAFHPADITLTLPPHLDLPAQLLPTVSRILDLYNAQANAHLSHHVDKYITLHHTPHKTHHGYALLRLGLSERYAELVTGLFDTQHTNALELDQSQSAWLRELYEKRGVAGGGRLTEREKRMVASMLRLEVEDVEEWWEVQGRKLRGFKGMKLWMKAREVEGLRRAKLLDLY